MISKRILKLTIIAQLLACTFLVAVMIFGAQDEHLYFITDQLLNNSTAIIQSNIQVSRNRSLNSSSIQATASLIVKPSTTLYPPNVIHVNHIHEGQITSSTINFQVGMPRHSKIEAYLKEHCKDLNKYAELLHIKDPQRHPCPCVSPDLKGAISVKHDFTVTFDDVIYKNPEVRKGGSWSPSWCQSYQHLAVIIPYRDREGHLQHLLNHLHPILQRQLLNYTVFVVEQRHPAVFNKAFLMNTAFTVSQDLADFDCYIFHDVDLLAEDDRLYHTCRTAKPIHLGAFHSKAKYKKPYTGHFGGVVAITNSMFRTVNGYSNMYFGWGREDDDMGQRLTRKKLRIQRMPVDVAKYTMMMHDRDEGNTRTEKANMALKKVKKTKKEDGLTTLAGKYTIVEQKELPLYTWILVDIDEAKLLRV